MASLACVGHVGIARSELGQDGVCGVRRPCWCCSVGLRPAQYRRVQVVAAILEAPGCSCAPLASPAGGRHFGAAGSKWRPLGEGSWEPFCRLAVRPPLGQGGWLYGDPLPGAEMRPPLGWIIPLLFLCLSHSLPLAPLLLRVPDKPATEPRVTPETATAGCISVSSASGRGDRAPGVGPHRQSRLLGHHGACLDPSPSSAATQRRGSCLRPEGAYSGAALRPGAAPGGQGRAGLVIPRRRHPEASDPVPGGGGAGAGVAGQRVGAPGPAPQLLPAAVGGRGQRHRDLLVHGAGRKPAQLRAGCGDRDAHGAGRPRLPAVLLRPLGPAGAGGADLVGQRAPGAGRQWAGPPPPLLGPPGRPAPGLLEEEGGRRAPGRDQAGPAPLPAEGHGGHLRPRRGSEGAPRPRQGGICLRLRLDAPGRGCGAGVPAHPRLGGGAVEAEAAEQGAGAGRLSGTPHARPPRVQITAVRERGAGPVPHAHLPAPLSQPAPPTGRGRSLPGASRSG